MKLRYLLLIFGVAFVGLLVARLPLSVVLDAVVPQPVTYARAVGTVWNGHVRGLRLRGVPMGDADLALSPLSLLRLSPGLDWRLGGGAVTGHGWLSAGLLGRSITLRDTDVAADLERLPTMVPLSGLFAATVHAFSWDGAACRTADVDLRTSALNRNPMGLDWRGPTLTGTASCDHGALTVTLAGKDASSDLAIKGTISPELAYRLDVALKTDNRDLRQSLAAMGHDEGQDGFHIHFEGMIGVDPSEL
jgi:hypothetical protein